MKDSSSNMLQIYANILQNGRLQLKNAANSKQNGRLQ